MPQPSDGNSQAGASEENFEFDPKSGEMKSDSQDVSKAGEADQQQADNAGEKQTTTEAQNNQQTKPDTDGQGSQKTTGQEDQGAGDQTPAPVKQGKIQHEAVNLVGAYLDGDTEKAKQFFAEHPEIALIANSSKKYKDQYRELIGAKKEVQIQEKTETSTEEQKPEEKKETEKPKEEEETIDEDELTDRVYAKGVEKGLVAERKVAAEAFAVKNGINADNVDALHEAAEAMHKANSNLPHSKCLEGAKVTIEGSLSKDSTVNMPAATGGQEEGKPSQNKEAEIQRIMKEHNCDKEKATQFVEKQLAKGDKAYKGEDNEWNDM